MKTPKVKQKKFDGFGFGYLFVDGKATVVSKLEGKNARSAMVSRPRSETRSYAAIASFPEIPKSSTTAL